MTEIYRFYFNNFQPGSDNLVDLGTGTLRFNNLWLAGSAIIPAIATTGLSATSSQIVGLVSTGITVRTRFFALGTAQFSSLNATSSLRITSGNKGLTEMFQGDIWHDTTQKTIMVFTNSSRLALSGVLFTQTGNAVVANNATEATLIGSGFGSTTLSPNFFVPGKTIRITASGLYETQLVPVSLNIRLRLGGLAGTVIHSTGDQTPAGGVTSEWWRYLTDIVCQTTGATGSVIGQGTWEHQSTALGSPILWAMTNLGVTLDTTTALIVQFTADWGAGVAAADSMMCTSFTLESLN